MNTEVLVSNIPIYSKRLIQLQARINAINEKLNLINKSSYESAFITDIFVNQLKATNNITDLYTYLEYDLADTNAVVLPEI